MASEAGARGAEPFSSGQGASSPASACGASGERSEKDPWLGWKRGIDLAVATCALPVLVPLLCLVAFWARLERRGPVLAREERLGKNFRRFRLLSFRTDSTAPGAGSPAAVGADPAPGRLPASLRFVRRWRLEGFPRFLNVLRGDMSLVGPGPEPPNHPAPARDQLEELLRVRPGLVDPASLRRSRERRPRTTDRSRSHNDSCYAHLVLRRRARLASEYVRSASPLGDVAILSRALFEFLDPRGMPVVRNIALSAGEVLKRWRRPLIWLVQAAFVVLSVRCAFLIRFDGEIPPAYEAVFWRSLPLLLALRLAAFVPFGLHSGLWRYASVRDLRNIAGSVALSSFLFMLADRYVAALESYPRSVVVIDSLLLAAFLGALRLSKRTVRGLRFQPSGKTRVLVIGAGDAGEALLREMEMHPRHGYVPVGLIDDDRSKRGTRIRGVRVLGTRGDLESVVETRSVDELVIAIPSAGPDVLRDIVAECRRLGMPVKTLPGLGDLLASGRLIDTIRDVEPEDLLCRPPVTEVSPELQDFYRGKRVLVTGAGGSIGSELVRQLAQRPVAELVLFEQHEYSLYRIDQEIRRDHEVRCLSVIGDILDFERLMEVFEKRRPDYVFHAAAYKHVPLMEQNPTQAVRVNVLGTNNLCEVARRTGVERLVSISSDKAVAPASVMGATKRLGEEILQDFHRAEHSGRVAPLPGRNGNGNSRRRTLAVLDALCRGPSPSSRLLREICLGKAGMDAVVPGGARERRTGHSGTPDNGHSGGKGRSDTAGEERKDGPADAFPSGRTAFFAVRFGNVLESSGSVVPLFKEQIRRGGPVTVTHPDVERYFMTTCEAVHLVLHAAMLGEGGETFVLDMGEPIKLVDMARHLISLYGFEPGTDIDIVFTGLRPGEKLSESLFDPDEEILATAHPKVLKAVRSFEGSPPSRGCERGRQAASYNEN